MQNTSQQQEQLADCKKQPDSQGGKIKQKIREEIFYEQPNILTGQNISTNNNFEIKNTRVRLLIVDERYRKEIEQFLLAEYSIDHFADLTAYTTDDNILNQHHGVIGIRKILAIAENAPIQAVINAGLVPKMIEYIRQQEYPQLQLQAGWALACVASGTTAQCQSIVDKGGIPLFVNILLSNNLGIVEQAIWAIGNISSGCVANRDKIIREGGLINLVSIMDKLTDERHINRCCWALSNLCRGSPLPKYDNIKLAIPVLCHVIVNGKLTDKQILQDCFWAISWHSDGGRKKIETVFDSGVVPKIIKFLEENAVGIDIPCIRILGGISTGSAEHTDKLLKNGILGPLEKFLDHHKRVVRREACWVVSNITAGNKSQIQAVLKRESMLKSILHLFETDGNDVKRQICYIFSNMANSGDPQQIFYIYKTTNIVRYYLNIISSDDTKALEVALECLYKILAHGQKFKGNGKNLLVLDIHFLGAVELLLKLQHHLSELVCQNATKILQTYFNIQGLVNYN